jgi:hypothetical protein
LPDGAITQRFREIERCRYEQRSGRCILPRNHNGPHEHEPAQPAYECIGSQADAPPPTTAEQRRIAKVAELRALLADGRIIIPRADK